MARRAKKRVSDEDLKIGALVRIPLRGKRMAIGQIVRPGIECYMCIFFPILADSKAAIPKIDSMKPQLCVLMSDEPFNRGKWSLIGEADLHPKIPFPHHKVDVYGKGMVIVDLDEKFVRKASRQDQRRIPYRINVGYQVVTNAIESLLAKGCVPNDDEHMLASVIKRRRLIHDDVLESDEEKNHHLPSASKRKGKSSDPDAELLRAMARGGADLSKRHTPEFSLIFASKVKAAGAAKKLQKLGFKVQIDSGDDPNGEISITARKRMMLSVEALRSLAIELRRLALRYGGSYDGWGAEIVA